MYRCSVFAADVDETFLASADNFVVLCVGQSNNQFAVLPRLVHLPADHSGTAVQLTRTCLGLSCVSFSLVLVAVTGHGVKVCMLAAIDFVHTVLEKSLKVLEFCF